MKRFTFKNFDLKNKTVFLRVDYNVPLERGKIVDNNKIKASLPTIRHLLDQDCTIILATHLGKPKGKIVPELKVDLLAEELKNLLFKRKISKRKIIKFDDCIGKELKEKIVKAKPKQIFLLENLRFYKEEEKNDPAFAHSLANLADVYVNDAFAVSHRRHASMEAITHFLPCLSGFLLEKEILYLSKALKPKRPAVWIMGGAKLDKIDLIKQALKKADKILIGGALAFSFLKAKGIKVGLSKTDKGSVKLAKRILKKWSAKKIVLPIDFAVAEKLVPNAKSKIVAYHEIKSNQVALDLGPGTIKMFQRYLSKAKTVVWNGPLGYFEWAKFATATKEIGRSLDKLNAVKVAGGGETTEAIHKFHLAHNFTHISTGGGAALQFLSGKKMPGIIALEKNYTRFKKKIPRKKRGK